MVYIEALGARIQGACLAQIRIAGPFLLRTVAPPIQEAEGKAVRELRRVGKRIAIGLEGDLWLVLHLMVAGRLHWQDFQKPTGRKSSRGCPGKKALLAAFEFSSGTLLLTEARAKRRASLHVVQGEDGLKSLDLGGLEVLECTLADFCATLTRSNHTLKRALTDPRLISGIGNAYSDEILHRARLSPVTLTQRLSEEVFARLYEATRQILKEWVARLRTESARLKISREGHGVSRGHGRARALQKALSALRREGAAYSLRVE